MSRNVSFVFHQRSAKQEVAPESEASKQKKKEKKLMLDEDIDGDYSGPESDDADDEDYE